MYDQEHQDKTSETADRENRRRFIKGASAVAPVILTLTSPSIFGAELCLSQQLSGNASGTPVGVCIKGKTPAYWQNPLNKSSWPTGFSYGTISPGKTGLDCRDYITNSGKNLMTLLLMVQVPPRGCELYYALH